MTDAQSSNLVSRLEAVALGEKLSSLELRTLATDAALALQSPVETARECARCGVPLPHISEWAASRCGVCLPPQPVETNLVNPYCWVIELDGICTDQVYYEHRDARIIASDYRKECRKAKVLALVNLDDICTAPEDKL